MRMIEKYSARGERGGIPGRVLGFADGPGSGPEPGHTELRDR